MNKIATSLFAGLPIVAFACAGCGSNEDHPSSCAAGLTSCPNSQFCVAPGGTCPKGNGLDAAVLPNGSDRGPIVAGDGGPCDASPQGALGTKITLNVSLPATAVQERGSGTLSLWLLLRYAVDGSGAIAGTVETCGMQMPVILYRTGSTAPALPEPPPAPLQITIPAGSWDGTPTTPITGTRGGSSIGSTFAIDPVVTLFGVKSTSALDTATQAWPLSATDFVASDLTYADGGAYQAGVGEPGILAIPVSDQPEVTLATSLKQSSPQADELWFALRTEFRLLGSVVSCTKQAGTVVVDHLDTSVVGCHVTDGGPCTMDQYVFLDGNRPRFGPFPADGSFQAMPMVGAGCKDVLAKLP
jgi:hypothetical protein